jgi:hypothetical protein
MKWIHLEDNGDGTTTLNDAEGKHIVFTFPLDRLGFMVIGSDLNELRHIRDTSMAIPSSPTPQT